MAHEFNLETYIQFLTANGNRYSSVEAAKALQKTNDAPAHNSASDNCDFFIHTKFLLDIL